MSFSMEESNLLDRLSDYESRGWLSRHDYHQYRSLMKQHPRNERSMKKISTSLDGIANRRHGHNGAASLTLTDDNSSDATSSTDSPSAVDLWHNREHHVSWEDQLSSDADASSSLKQKQQGSSLNPQPPVPLLMEPTELWNRGRFTRPQLQEVFVEMCFFARLGFVQPPCCLSCTYRQAMQPKTATTTNKSVCHKWVVWRKHASTLLHPDKINGNIILVQCHVAKELLDGKLVEGQYWDAAKKRLLHATTAH